MPMAFLKTGLQESDLLLISCENTGSMANEIDDDGKPFNADFPPRLRASVVGWLLTSSFPRLLIEMFSSQMRSYTKLSFNAQDRP